MECHELVRKLKIGKSECNVQKLHTKLSVILSNKRFIMDFPMTSLIKKMNIKCCEKEFEVNK